MFEQLLQLPLFQGLSSETISLLVEKYPFHFLKFHDGEKIIEVGENNTHARFIVSGSARVKTRFSHLQVELSQTLTAPQVLGAVSLFGMNTTFPYEAVALGTCGVLQIKKSDYISMLQGDKVLLFNILNYLSLNSQRFTTSLLSVKQCSLIERLAIVVESLTTRNSSDVVLSYRQKDLCSLLGTQRNTLINAIETLAEAGIVTQDGNCISINDLRQFSAYCKDSHNFK